MATVPFPMRFEKKRKTHRCFAEIAIMISAAPLLRLITGHRSSGAFRRCVRIFAIRDVAGDGGHPFMSHTGGEEEEEEEDNQITKVRASTGEKQ